MSKSDKKQNRFIDALLCLVFSVILAYVVAAFLKALQMGVNVTKILLNVPETYSWLIHGKRTDQALPLITLIGSFVYMITKIGNKRNGYEDASDHGAHGNARFSDIKELRKKSFIADRKDSKYSENDPFKTLHASKGIILGRDEKNNELIIIPPDSSLDNRNVLGVGSAGSAKTQAFVIPNLINNQDDTIIVTDPKGELYDLTADIKRDQGYKVYQIDFMNLTGTRYNPLDYVKKDIDARKIADSISMNSAKDVKQDFWFSTARDLLIGLILYTKSVNPNASIPVDVKREFNRMSEDPEYLYRICERIGEEHPAYQYLKDASVATGNTRTGILNSFSQQTSIFNMPEVKRLTSASDISFYDLQEEKSILYIKIPVKGNPVAPLTATFFDQLISTLYEIGDQNHAKLKIPTIFLLDEFANIGKINDYDNTLATCRGYRMSMMTIVQDFAQLESKYGKEEARTIINNHDTTLFLRTKDVETAKYFERLAGDTTIRYKTGGTSSSGGGIFGKSSSSVSTSEQLVKKPLIAEYEFLNMDPPDKCYVFMAGHVLRLKKAYQYLIYNGLITDENRQYCYPKNRDRYIEEFGLTTKNDDEVKEVDTKNNALPQEEQEELETVEITTGTNERNSNPSDQESKREQQIKQFVASYLSEIQKNKKDEAVAATMKDKKLEETEENIKENVLEDEEDGSLNELEMLALVKEKQKEGDDKLKEIQEGKMVRDYCLLEEESYSNQFNEDDNDDSDIDLPM